MEFWSKERPQMKSMGKQLPHYQILDIRYCPLYLTDCDGLGIWGLEKINCKMQYKLTGTALTGDDNVKAFLC